jgi:DNA polymerase (family X)
MYGLSESAAAALARRGYTTRRQLLRVIDELPTATQAELRHQPRQSLPLKTGQKIAALFKEHAVGLGRGGSLRVVGSIRRGKARLKDIDLLLVVPKADALRLSKLALKRTRKLALLESYAQGSRRRSLIVRMPAGPQGINYRVDVFLAERAELPYALLHHTGSSRYNIRLRAHAKARGWRLNQYGLFDRQAGGAGSTGARVAGTARVKTEQQLARFLGVTYRPPQGRAC